MKEHGFAGVDARSAVRYLTDGIKDSSLDATKNTILASEELRANFEGCVQLFKDFIGQRGVNKTLNVSEVSTGNGKRKSEDDDGDEKHVHFAKGQKKGKSGVQFRYYKRAEYAKLNEEQRAELHQWRKSQKPAGKDTTTVPVLKKPRTGGTGIDRQINALASNLEKLNTAMVAAVGQGEEGEVDEADSTANDNNNNTNRNNAALTRQPGARRRF